MLIKKESQYEFANLMRMKCSGNIMLAMNTSFHEVVQEKGRMVDYVGSPQLLVLSSEYDKLSIGNSRIMFEDVETTTKTHKEFKITTSYTKSQYDDVHYLLSMVKEIKSEEIIKKEK